MWLMGSTILWCPRAGKDSSAETAAAASYGLGQASEPVQGKEALVPLLHVKPWQTAGHLLGSAPAIDRTQNRVLWKLVSGSAVRKGG